MKPEFEIYTDGACVGNGLKENIGGWSFVFVNDAKNFFEAVGLVFNTTNNRQDMLAVLNSLRCCVEYNITSFVIYCDSQYVVKGFTDWMFGWQRRGWIRGIQNTPIPNADLWKELYEIGQEFNTVNIQWVRGHNGNIWNEYAVQIIEKELAKSLTTNTSR